MTFKAPLKGIQRTIEAPRHYKGRKNKDGTRVRKMLFFFFHLVKEYIKIVISEIWGEARGYRWNV